MEICGKCMGTGVAGHPDSGYTCDCNGGMTDPTPTRAEVDRFGCDQLGMDKMPDGEWVRFTDYQDLRERAEAAEDNLASAKQLEQKAFDHAQSLQAALTEARSAEAAAWNDAIEAAALEAEWRIMPAFAASIRALRRAAPAEGEA